MSASPIRPDRGKTPMTSTSVPRPSRKDRATVECFSMSSGEALGMKAVPAVRTSRTTPAAVQFRIRMACLHTAIRVHDDAGPDPAWPISTTPSKVLSKARATGPCGGSRILEGSWSLRLRLPITGPSYRAARNPESPSPLSGARDFSVRLGWSGEVGAVPPDEDDVGRDCRLGDASHGEARGHPGQLGGGSAEMVSVKSVRQPWLETNVGVMCCTTLVLTTWKGSGKGCPSSSNVPASGPLGVVALKS